MSLRSFALPFLLLCAFAGALRAESSTPVPRNLVTEGIPPIPGSLRKEVAHYLSLGGASFRGWNTSQRQAIVTTRDGDSVQLHTVAEPLGKRTQLTHWTEQVAHGWFQPGGTLFVFQSDKGGDEQYQIYALDTAKPGSEPRLLTDGASQNTSPVWSHHGLYLAYTSTRRNGKDRDVYIVNPLKPETSKCLLTANSPGWSVEDWNKNATKLLLRKTAGENRSELWIVDKKNGDRVQITHKEDPIYFAHARFAEKDKAVYGMSYDHSDFLSLVRLDVDTGLHETLTANIPWDVEDFQVSPDGRTIAFVTNEDGFSKLHLLDIETRKELRVPNIPGDIISDLSWREKSHELGFTLSSAQSPHDVWSLDVDSGELTRWTDRLRKTATQDTFSEPEVVHVKADDGVQISCLVYRPDPRRFPGPRPVLISIHGGPAAQSRPGFLGNGNYFLNEAGIALVFPNVRGSTGYGKKFTALDDGFGREAAVGDIGTVIKWIQKDRLFDPKHIGVRGGSYGGFMTLACMVKYHDILRCGVDSVGIANFVTFLKDTSDYRRDNRRAEYGDERKPEMKEFLDKISPANHADQIRAPLFIIQGKNDPRVPVTEAERMRDAIRQNGGMVWYLMATDEGHGFSKKSNINFEFDATVLFLRQYLLN